MAEASEANSPETTQWLCALVTGRLTPDELSSAQWAAVAALALEQGLAPTLYFTCIDGNARARAAAGAAVALLELPCLSAAATTILQQEEARRWALTFRAHGIDAIWLKGIPLSLAYYPSPVARTMGDIDVLVPRRQLQETLKLISCTIGVDVSAPAIGTRWAQETAVNLGRVMMDLHWGMVGVPGSRVAPDMDWFMDQRTTLLLEGCALTTFTPEAHLLHLCAHALLQHGEATCMLQRYFDLHCLLSHTPRIDWDLIVTRAARLRWTHAVERALHLTNRYFGTALPADLFARLAAARHRDENKAWISRRQVRSSRWEQNWLLLAPMKPGARLAFATAHLFPPPAHMRVRYNLTGGWQVPLAYFWRWFDVGRGALGLLLAAHTKAKL